MQIRRPVPKIRVIPVGNVSDYKRAYTRVVDIIRQTCNDMQENPQELKKENTNFAIGKKKEGCHQDEGSGLR